MNLPSRIGKLEQARSVEVCSQCGQSPGAYADVAAAVRDALADPHVVSCKPILSACSKCGEAAKRKAVALIHLPYRSRR
jgi:ribosomal protein L32